MSDRADANLRFLRDRLSLLADVIEPDPTSLGAVGEPTAEASPDRARTLPAGKLAAGLALALAGLALMVFFPGDGEPTEEEAPTTTEVSTEPTPAGEEPPPRTEPGPPVDPGPAEPTHPGRPVRPTAIKPGVAMLLPSLLTAPSQPRLERVWAALKENPQQVTAILSRLATVKQDEQRIVLLLALAAANGDPAVRNRLLAEVQGSGRPAVRRAAAAALGHMSGEDHPRVKATRTLSVQTGVIEDESRRGQLLAAAASERDPDVLGTLIRLLGPSRSLDREIDERLFELARSPSAGLRQAAIDGLRTGTGGDRRTLGRLIEDEEIPATDRAKLVEAYGSDENQAEALARLTGLIERSEEMEIREAAVRALVGVKSEGARRKAVEILTNPGVDRKLRLAALGVVSAVDSAESRKTLQGIADGDGDEMLRSAAKELLRAINPEKKSDGK